MKLIDVLKCNAKYDEDRIKRNTECYCPHHLNSLNPYTEGKYYIRVCKYNKENNIEDSAEHECYVCWHQDIKEENEEWL